MKTYSFGTTVTGLAIPAFRWEEGGPEVLVIGGVHGDEPEGVIAAHALLRKFFDGFPFRLSLTLVPALNLDGVLAASRLNARGVDLNRNLATRDWDPKAHQPRYNPGTEPNSEPENQALVSYLEKRKPRFVMSLHSWKPVLNVNGGCIAEAEAISKVNGYRIDESIGYPTPGCLGTYAGIERDMPTLTFEIERGLAPAAIVSDQVPAILAGLRSAERERRPVGQSQG